MQEASSQKIQAALAIVHHAMARIAALSDALNTGLPGSSLHAVAERLYSERRRRDEHFPRGIFGEPAWDMMLALFIAREEGREVTFAEAYEAAGVRAGPGRALIRKLEATGILRRGPAQRDRKCQSVCLTDDAVERLSDYLAGLL
ncbi:MAG TPA: hypothetical protein VN231_14880 [Allosphingosinicella sp.]|nr:hypothetical protein [Allosphingosinicella sp.]